MWVNVTDSLLSIVLVWLLIPRLGILGYAVCIIVMEAYNFVLSIIRLGRRIRIRINVMRCVILPLLASLASSWLVRALFVRAGSTASPLWLVAEIIFAIAAYVLVTSVSEVLVSSYKSKHLTVRGA